ncbi:Deoxyribose-phosphate aldolase/phospho-2-dehydro-3-deoxyheptonate aldolase [Shigella flexneri]|uniref:Deoxyribose-phosphate aldolase/phospho-2-dehydro-3-deoxyheptonate aldolase,lysozyme inhibitor n=1 Tax=Shigella flexneri TaxID=623 RepID=A0AB33SEG5_SHIFL|nr:hypothetical protein SFy_2384 [Shigella flexneri 2003036]AIL40735.1 hypothetical protein SFyv_2435 [Shigella flexneri Shi06HN006]EFS13354.1 putative lipoprotein [Shigella flexneri 2a str. 2457T]EGJ87295.1 putative lipoprotein [Shigella flexneri 4343-70]EIQ28391.1 putative lipoprotein [Shigella flexneri K-404]EJL14657.1 putative lipoprotein [Shigella flexneri 6603-63]CDX07022.1 Deoxyribose-phosphate aldolase/phospho-2-dehydro-3-deoxyheptonate aldolase,lysozyme inhibitor [Shigella flexneri]
MKKLLIIILPVLLSGCSAFNQLVVDWPPESPDNQYHLFK